MFAIQKVFHPEIYQGRYKRDHYFEGWYYKQVSADQKYSIAFIPGVSLSQKDPHAFVQVIIADKALDAGADVTNQKTTLVTDYYHFSLSDFKFQDNPFSIQIGKNIFSKSDIFIDLRHEHLKVEGHLVLSGLEPITKSLMFPNIMGIFGYLPFMECYHGIISMWHVCNGRINVNGKEAVYSGGVGYIEKDWGNSFPKEYVWVQCNHFTNKKTAMVMSAAHIPFCGSSFKGFFCILNFQGREYRWATYNDSEIIIEVVSEKKQLYLMKQKQFHLQVEAEILDQGVLASPQNGQMIHTIKEGLSGKVKVKLMNPKGDVLYEDSGTSAGIEFVKKMIE